MAQGRTESVHSQTSRQAPSTFRMSTSSLSIAPPSSLPLPPLPPLPPVALPPLPPLPHLPPPPALPYRPLPLSYMPFSEGPRSCVGQSLAKLEVMTVLATLLAHFRVELAEEVRAAMGGQEAGERAGGCVPGLNEIVPSSLESPPGRMRGRAEEGEGRRERGREVSLVVWGWVGWGMELL